MTRTSRQAMPAVSRILLTLGLVAIGVYVAIVAVMFVYQRDLLYRPDPRLIQPHVDELPIRVVRLTTPDGERLVAWYLPPQEGSPVILHLNGNAGGLASQQWRWRRIARAGVGFLAVAYRGYGGSSGHPSEAGLLQDARTGYDFLASRFAPQSIVIHGYSLGSGPAVRLAVERPARALVLEAPYTSAMEVAELEYPWLPVSLLMQDRFMSRDWIGKVHIPVLIVHGDRDSVIPFRMGQELYALANRPKLFVRMAGSDHNTLVRDGLYDHVWPFLGVRPPAAADQAVAKTPPDALDRAPDR
jgi:fermentation-respiration switch protein FrsA (DUF1100 family)